MKGKLFFIVSAVVALRGAGAFAQANTSLSNLVAPTAINASLLFDTDNAYTVGSATDGASTVYTTNVSASTGDLTVSTPNVVNNPGSKIFIQAGNSTNSGGGEVHIYGGTSSGSAGGNIVIIPGAGTGMTPYQAELQIFGHIRFGNSGNATLSACGTSPTINGSDNAGSINVGTATATCTVNFFSAWGTKPVCFVSNETARIAVKIVPSTTSFVVSAAANFAAGTVLDYMCVAAN